MIEKKKEKKQNKTNAPKEIITNEFGDIFPRHIPWPFILNVSGLYEWNWRIIQPIPIPRPFPYKPLEGGEGYDIEEPTTKNETEALYPIVPWYFNRAELRLDVDGRYPQMTASGTMNFKLRFRVHWIASLYKVARNQWVGKIWYKHGSTTSFPYTKVEITATPSWFMNQRKVTVVFTGGGGISRTITYKYKSRYYHPVEFEFDKVSGAPRITSVNTHDHPNRPANIANETLTIENVYRRTGFDVKKSGNDSIIPLSAAGTNSTWSDMEMHDAMKTYWSRFADKPQWSMWVLFASLHDQGTSLGGIMFDDIGPNHRQGTAIFGDAFISNAPSGDKAPNAWVRRMRFWTACHEMGHAFNLAHSWQKELGAPYGTPWITLQNENEVRSFMNYPYNVSGGQSAFFADFEYRFSDSEMLFMRHAPSQFVQMGNADWFDHHGFQQANAFANPEYKLEIRVNRKKPIFEFLEPVVLELKLTNISSESQLFDTSLLSSGQDIIVILKKEGKFARQWSPFAKYCSTANSTVIESKKSIYHPLFVSAGVNGWDISEPGIYQVQVAIKNNNEYIISNPLTIRVTPPHGFDEEFIAQDVFTEDVGRVLAMRGSRFLKTANNTLSEVVARLPKSRVAYHARMALGNPLSRDYKLLTLDEGKKRFKIVKKDIKGTTKELDAALVENVSESTETLGHINYKNSIDSYCEFLSGEGLVDVAAKRQEEMHIEFKKRQVLPSVLEQILNVQKSYGSKS